MKKGFILMLVCLLALTSLKLADRYIHWSSTRPLVWGDFQGQPEPLKARAITYAFMSKTPYKKNPDFIYVIACFDKQKSWVVAPDSLGNLGLIHEQGHFDIIEIYARKFNNEFKDIKMSAREKESLLQTKRFDEIAEEMNKTEANYDKETQGYYNQTEQIRWNKWIKKQLDSIPKIEFE